MIAPYRPIDFDSNENERLSWLPLTAVLIGLGCGLLFSYLWPGFHGLAALAVWPLGLAAGLLMTVFGTAVFARQIHWDLLFVGKLLALVGTLMFFVSSL